MTIIETSIISKTETFGTPKTDNESNIKYISKTKNGKIITHSNIKNQ